MDNGIKFGIGAVRYISENGEWHELCGTHQIKVETKEDTPEQEWIKDIGKPVTLKLKEKRKGTGIEKDLWYYHHSKNRRIKQKHNFLKIFGIGKPHYKKIYIGKVRFNNELKSRS